MLESAPQALAALDGPLLSGVGAEMGSGLSAREAWQRIADREGRRGGRMDALTVEDRRALSELFEHLGEIGREQQASELQWAVKALEQNLESAERGAAEADRLYLSLGTLVGLMLTLIVV